MVGVIDLRVRNPHVPTVPMPMMLTIAIVIVMSASQLAVKSETDC
jgi:hypothetical protein